MKQMIMSAMALLATATAPAATAVGSAAERSTTIPAILITTLILFVLLVILFFWLLWKYRTQTDQDEQKQNKILSLILQLDNVSIWTWDLKTNIITQYRRDLSTGNTYTYNEMRERLSQEDGENMLAAFQKVVLGVADRVQVEMTSKVHDDEAAVLSISVLEYENDKPSVILGVLRIIAANKLRKEKIQIQRRRYKSIFETSLADIMVFDKDGYILYTNERAHKTFNLPDDATLRERRMNIKDNKWYADLDLNELENMELASKDEGGRMYYRSFITPIYDENYNLELICVRGYDITELVGNMKQTRDYALQVQKATEGLDKMTQRANFAILSGGMRLVSYNPYTRSMKMYKTLTERMGEIDEMELFDEVEPNSFPTIVKNITRMNKLEDEKIQYTYQRPQKEGQEPVYELCSMIPVYDEYGAIRRYFGMISDESELISTRMQLEEEKKKAQESDLVKNAFLRNMTDEIRNPLNTVIGHADKLLRGVDREEEQVCHEEIKRNTTNMLTLVNNVLLLSRLDAGMVESVEIDVDLPPMLENTCKIASSRISRPGVEVEFENPYDQLLATIDYHNLEEVILRLIGCLAHKTDKSQIMVKYEYISGFLSVIVSDTSMEMIRRLEMDNVSRFPRDGKDAGFGLELPICRMLVELLDGNISVYSSEDHGSTIWVNVPCKVATLKQKRVVYISE